MIVVVVYLRCGACASSRSLCRVREDPATWYLQCSQPPCQHLSSGRPLLMRFAFVRPCSQLTRRIIPCPACRTVTFPSPGMHFVDGWAASVVAACASLDKAAKANPSISCQEAMDVPVVARTLQLLYGARKRFIDARAAARDIAYSTAQGLNTVNRHSKFDVEAAVARIVTDHFTEWSTYLHSVSSNVTSACSIQPYSH